MDCGLGERTCLLIPAASSPNISGESGRVFGVTLRGQIPFGDKVSLVFVENRKTMLKGRRVRVSHSSRSPRGWLVPPPPYFKIQTRICDLSTSNSLPVPVPPPARLSVRLRRLRFIRCQGSPRWMDGFGFVASLFALSKEPTRSS